MAIPGNVVYVCTINPDKIRRRDNGVWSDEFVSPTYDVAAITESRDGSGTLFMLTGGTYRLYRKLKGGSWVLLGTPSDMHSLKLSSPDSGECWGCTTSGVGRWREGLGFTSFFGGGIPGATVWAFSRTNIITVGNTATNVMRTFSYVGSDQNPSYTSFVQRGSNFGGNSGGMLFSPDGGTTIYLTRGGLSLTKTTDQGLTWSSTISPIGGGANFVWCIWGLSNDDLWISYAAQGVGVDTYHWNGSTWTPYTVNGGNGISSVSGIATNEVYFSHVNNPTVSRWDGATFTPEASGGGNTGYSYQNIWAVAGPTTPKILPEQIEGGTEVTETFVATAPDGNNRQQFTLATEMDDTTEVPAGYMVWVFVNGIKHKFNSPAGTREFDIISNTVIEVGGLSLNDDVEIVFGV